LFISAPRQGIAADTSSLVAFLEGADGDDVEMIQAALDDHQLVLLPVVLTELLSDPGLPASVRSLLTALPQLQLEPVTGSVRACFAPR
jgi:hypothetical protein